MGRTLIHAVALHNSQHNRDAVWFMGLVRQQDGPTAIAYTLYRSWGRRGQKLQHTQEVGPIRLALTAGKKLHAKLAEGYKAVNWADPMYGLASAVRALDPLFDQQYHHMLHTLLATGGKPGLVRLPLDVRRMSDILMDAHHPGSWACSADPQVFDALLVEHAVTVADAGMAAFAHQTALTMQQLATAFQQAVAGDILKAAPAHHGMPHNQTLDRADDLAIIDEAPRVPGVYGLLEIEEEEE